MLDERVNDAAERHQADSRNTTRSNTHSEQPPLPAPPPSHNPTAPLFQHTGSAPLLPLSLIPQTDLATCKHPTIAHLEQFLLCNHTECLDGSCLRSCTLCHRKRSSLSNLHEGQQGLQSWLPPPDCQILWIMMGFCFCSPTLSRPQIYTYHI